MKRASAIFPEADRKVIEQAVAEAERRTAAEIVVVAATRSGRYDRAEDLAGLTLAVLVTTATWLVSLGAGPSGAQWQTMTSKLAEGAVLLAVFLVTFALGTALASRVFVLARPFVSRAEMLEEVEHGALIAFHRFRVGRTARGTAMLIYVSLAERLVRVVGDHLVDRQVDRQVWSAARDRIVEGFRTGRPAEAIADAARECGTVLEAHFPIEDDEVNELTNELILID